MSSLKASESAPFTFPVFFFFFAGMELKWGRVINCQFDLVALKSCFFTFLHWVHLFHTVRQHCLIEFLIEFCIRIGENLEIDVLVVRCVSILAVTYVVHMHTRNDHRFVTAWKFFTNVTLVLHGPNLEPNLYNSKGGEPDRYIKPLPPELKNANWCQESIPCSWSGARVKIIRLEEKA